jgi:hypothetical protein
VIGATVHQKFGILRVKRLEERKSHQMVPMGMGEKKMDIERFFFNQLFPKSANSRTRINRNDIPAFGADLQTRCIAAVF